MLLFGDDVKIEENRGENVKKGKSIGSQDKKEKTEAKVEKSSKSLKTKVIESEEVFTITQELKEITSFKKIEDGLLRQYENGKMHHAIMFSGDYGIGKATFAYWMISRFFSAKCKMAEHNEGAEKQQKLEEMHLESLRKNIHPDVFFLKLKEGENEIKVEQVRELINKIGYKSIYGDKFVIIDDINSINTNGVNALLKTLEEPPENTYFFIINHKTTHLLDTIYSRCNEIKLSLSRGECMKILQNLHADWSFDEIEFFTDIAGNSVGYALICQELGLKDFAFAGQEQELPAVLNNIYKKIEGNKTLPLTLKVALLERILLFFVKQKLVSANDKNDKDKIKQIVSQNNSIIKQFLDIKRFELPVRFV